MILAVIVLSWNFVFTDTKKIELTDSAKVLQGLSMAIKYKIAIKEYWKNTGSLPDAEAWQKSGTKIKVDLSRSLVEKIEVAVDGPGVISVYFTNKQTRRVEKDIDGTKVMLIPEPKGDRLAWACKGTLEKDYLPAKCQ